MTRVHNRSSLNITQAVTGASRKTPKSIPGVMRSQVEPTKLANQAVLMHLPTVRGLCRRHSNISNHCDLVASLQPRVLGRANSDRTVHQLNGSKECLLDFPGSGVQPNLCSTRQMRLDLVQHNRATSLRKLNKRPQIPMTLREKGRLPALFENSLNICRVGAGLQTSPARH